MQNYEEAIDANIAVHSAMADKYNTVEPQFKPESIARVKKNIDYLQKQLAKTSMADMKAVFYSLIEEQTKTLMLE